jgi:hypothetical protein
VSTAEQIKALNCPEQGEMSAECKTLREAEAKAKAAEEMKAKPMGGSG